MSSYDNEKEKRELLTQRGFRIGNQDIETYFANYEGRWRIRTISKEEVVKETDLQLLKKKLFAKDSIEPSINSTVLYDTFDFFAEPIQPFQVAASELDPYIARFVTVVNEIGVKTLMSCDGWHRNQDQYSREVRLWMYDRFSVYWLWLITEYVFGETWIRSKADDYAMWKNKWQPDNSRDYEYPFEQCKMIIDIERGDERKVYDKIQRYAEYLEQNRELLLRIREKWIQAFRNDDKLMAEANDKDKNFIKMHRKIREIIEEDLVAMKWGNKKL